MFYLDLVKLLRAACLSCHMLLATHLEKDYFYARMRLLDHNILNKMQPLDELYFRISEYSEDDARLIETGSYRDEFRKLVEKIIAENENEIDRTANRNVLKVSLKKNFLKC